jgi:uncharacterized protein (TIGR03089 family)
MNPAQLLTAALRRDPARPLITFYDDATGERAELSVATYANWVAKTANLLHDGLRAQPGDRVALRLPCHWQSAVWLGACWATGAVPVLGGDGADAAAVAVVALDDPAPPPAAAEIVGLGLGPMGLPRRDIAPGPHVSVDYDREIHAHGDRFSAAPLPPGSPALRLPGGQTLSAEELVERAETVAATWGIRPADRILCTGEPQELATVLIVTLVPLVTGASIVLSRHTDEAALPLRAASERLTAVLGPVPAEIRDIRRL